MISLPVMPNFVEVVEMAVMPWGKTYDCSTAVTSMLVFEKDDISELMEITILSNGKQKEIRVIHASSFCHQYVFPRIIPH